MPAAKSPLQTAIESIIKKGDSYELEPLTQDSLNQNFVLSASGKKFKVRINATVAGVFREQEPEILSLISDLDLGPVLQHFDPEYQFAVFEWQEGRSFCIDSLTDSQHLLLIQALSRFHSISLPASFTNLKSRLQLYKSIGWNVLSDQEQQLYLALFQQLESLSFFDVDNLIHSDLNPNNLIWGDSLKIIDWEFAGRGHPVFDIAVLNHYAEMELSQLPVYKSYLQGYKDGLDIYRCCSQIFPLLVKLWEAANLQPPKR